MSALTSQPSQAVIDFHGLRLKASHVIPGLDRVMKKNKQGHSYVVFIVPKNRRASALAGRIWWKIVPLVTPRGKIHNLKLYHRNRYGRAGFHVQRSEWGTQSGLSALLKYIQQHDQERGASYLD